MGWVQGYALYGLLIEQVACALSLSLSLSPPGYSGFKGLPIPHIDSSRSLDLATH